MSWPTAALRSAAALQAVACCGSKRPPAPALSLHALLTALLLCVGCVSDAVSWGLGGWGVGDWGAGHEVGVWSGGTRSGSGVGA